MGKEKEMKGEVMEAIKNVNNIKIGGLLWKEKKRLRL